MPVIHRDQASRTPVIATPAAAARDLIDGRNGVISSLDVGEFKKSVLDFMEIPPKDWKAASDAAFRTACKHDVTLAAQAFEDTLKHILSETR